MAVVMWRTVLGSMLHAMFTTLRILTRTEVRRMVQRVRQRAMMVVVRFHLMPARAVSSASWLSGRRITTRVMTSISSTIVMHAGMCRWYWAARSTWVIVAATVSTSSTCPRTHVWWRTESHRLGRIVLHSTAL